MKYLLITFLISYSILAHTQEHLDTHTDKILEEINKDQPGVIIGVIKDGQMVHSRAKGLANLETKTPITLSSRFRLSSTSKQFTAACIIHLYERKKLKLTDALSKYFPEYSSEIGKVRIQDLLHHTSGIRDYMSLLMIQGSNSMDKFSNYTGGDKELEKLISDQKELAFPPGTQHNYSNTNYWILGQLVKKISGFSIGKYAQLQIFEPLKMMSTNYIESSDEQSMNKAIGYLSPCPDCEIHPYNYTNTAVGDGGVISTIDDLLLWENEFYNHKILSSKGWDKMKERGVLQDGQEISYASGLIVEEYKGHKVIKHSGQNPGFSSQILKFPKERLSILVLANQNWYDTRKIASKVADLILEIKIQDPKQLSDRLTKSVILSKENLDKFCGDYIYPITGERRSIRNTPEGLLYLRSNGPSSKLLPLSKTTLTYEERPNVIMEFDFISKHQKNISWSDGTREMKGNIYSPLQLTKKELESYKGIYINDELDVALYITMNEQQLNLEMTGQVFPLESTKKDEFSAMGMLKLKFQKDENGKINGYRLDAPRAGNIYFALKEN